ncbi:MAG: hypothetical protein GY768_04480 [Planctomycetaceae bacterium]|nr:hypothetical protein [Planctomycetaceae bacterium]
MVQFICPECEQPLEAAPDKTSPILCPSCGIHLSLGEAGASLESLSDRDRPPAVPAADLQRKWMKPDGAFLQVRRSIVYSQAVLLACVAIVSFVLGAGFGGLYAPRSLSRQTVDGPCDIQGTVRQAIGDQQVVALGQAVVIFVPVDRRPEERWSILGISAAGDLPPSDHPSLIGIRLLGGAYAKTDPRGRYAARVAAAGDYYVLVLGGRQKRKSDWNKRELAEIGRYFQDVMSLLADREYRWQKLTVMPGERWDVLFEPNRPAGDQSS